MTEFPTGAFGVQMQLPPGATIVEEHEHALVLTDESNGAQWHIFFFPDLHMDLGPGHRDALSRALVWHARALFDQMYEQCRDPEDLSHEPRTNDPNWSPMVDVEFLGLDEAPALRTVHRMVYQPGQEVVMGHLLVPVRRGLLEVRVLCIDEMTGFRETVLFEKWAQDNGLDSEDDIAASLQQIRQSYYDDPAHDGLFPEHSLSRVRAAQRWLISEAGLRVLEHAPEHASRQTEVSGLGCALELPTGFVQDPGGDDPGRSAVYQRVSFCGTDGVQHFVVEATGKKVRERALQKKALARARKIHKKNQVREIQITEQAVMTTSDHPLLLTIIEGEGHLGRIQNTMGWFLDEEGRLWSLTLTNTLVVPAEVVASELTAAASSFRLLRLH